MKIKTTPTMDAVWNGTRPTPEHPWHFDVPKVGEMELVGGYGVERLTPLHIKWDANAATITIDGKVIKFIRDWGWAYKIRRDGLHASDLQSLIYESLEDHYNGCCGLCDMFYDAFAKAKKVCEAVSAA